VARVSPPALRADEPELPDVDGMGAEAAFAIGEIHLPHTPETFVEAEVFNGRPGSEETLAPFVQGGGVTVAEHHCIIEAQLGALELRFEPLDRGQHAAGEDVALNEVDALAVMLETLFGNGDDLQCRRAAARQTIAHRVEIARPMPLADSFEHLDRGNDIEGT